MKLLKVIILFCLIYQVQSQPAVKYSSIEIQAALAKLNVLGSMLYVAAHPDDENQGILTYMGKGKHYRTAYLSLTRGSGGQNLLGAEKGTLLGVLRTQELLATRKIDGAQQYFTRAIDFGYSKTPDEALTKWDHSLLLGDVVKVIRQVKPDVIITRFSEKWGSHGHHIASAILAKEAFTAAADPEKFTEQLNNLEPWQARRIVWNSWRPQERPADAPALLTLNLGEYNPLRGFSYQEIAAKGRSMHKSQGFGETPRRGDSFNYFEHTAGVIAQKDLFDNIDTSWRRVPGSEEIQNLINKIITDFIPENPQSSIPGLVDLYKALQTRPANYWIKIKKQEVQNLLQMCAGLWIESVALNEAVSPGDSIEIKTTILNRSNYNVVLAKTYVTYSVDSLFNEPLKNGRLKSTTSKILIPDDCKYSQPYWLKKTASETMFNVDKDFKGLAVENPQIRTKVDVTFNDLSLSYEMPVLYRWNDPVDGEKYKPFYIQPEVSISLSQNAYIFADDKTKEIAVTVFAHKDNLSGKIDIDLPKGWLIAPVQHNFSLNRINEQKTVLFKITPEEDSQNGEIKSHVHINDKEFNQQLIKIAYDHIPQQNILVPATAKLVKLDIIVPQKRVAYIMGTGDEIPQSLEQIGISVDLISDSDLQSKDYTEYDAVICGVRAFNTRKNLALLQKRILDYVEQGGVWIVQHNTRFGIQVPDIGPYPFVARGRSRISEEDAQIEIVEPSHPLLNFPNKITQKDFDNWVQERGTYLAESWDENFIPILSGHDKGEDPQKGGLLYSHYGKGIFIFTGFSWFRQLPAGVPGAYRIFINMICAGDKINRAG